MLILVKILQSQKKNKEIKIDIRQKSKNIKQNEHSTNKRAIHLPGLAG